MTETTTDRATINTVVRIPISDIIVDANIRRDTKMKPGFAANVKQHGVLEPVDAYQDDDGAWHLQDGQLRYLASLDSGFTDIPVLVNDPALAEAAKVIKQLNKNLQRADLSEADEATAWQTLFELGVSADSIAKKTNRPRKTVEQALEVVAVPFAAEQLQAGIGLDKVAAMLEFQDEPELIARLTQVAVEDPSEFAYALEEAKVDLAERAKRQALVDELTTAGIPVHDRGPIFNTATPLAQVFKDEKLTEQLEPTDNPAANGIIALVEKTERYDRERGWVHEWTAHHYVDDIDAHGLFAQKSTPAGKPPMTPEQSAERKRVIANNKAWPIATTVRVQWITDELLGRKSLPSDTIAFIAIAYAGGHPKSQYGSTDSLSRDWLDIKDASRFTHANLLVDELEKKPGSAERIALAIALGRAEEQLANKEAWRNYSDREKLARYLTALASWGHNLSPVEAELVEAAKKAAK